MSTRDLTTGEVATLFRVTEMTVVRWANDGLIPHYRTLGGHRRYKREDVDALRDTRTPGFRSTA